MNQDKMIDIYYDHYKNSFELNKEAQKRRNRFFIILCVLEAISIMLVFNPDFICRLLNDAVRKEIETTINFSNSILQTLVWILIAYFIIRYVQDMLYIEKQYIYIEELENGISKHLGKENIFNREGELYKSNYPVVLNIIDLFYKMIFPIFFAVVNLVHIFQEWRTTNRIGFLIVDTVLCLSIIIITWFYFFEIHNKITKFCKDYIPGIKWISEMIHKILKYI